MAVSTAMRSLGGVSITDMSRTPASDSCSVRGTGVADMASTWTSFFSCFRRSFWATPKRCSSSTMSSAELGELDVLRQQAVGADEDVDLAGGQALAQLPHLQRRAEARDHLDRHRKAGEAAAEGLQVLVGENRRRRQHRHLVAAVDRLEGGPHRHLGLAVADVAAEQAVHRPLALQVLLDDRDRLQLVGALLVGEGGLELALQVGVGRQRRRAWRAGARRRA